MAIAAPFPPSDLVPRTPGLAAPTSEIEALQREHNLSRIAPLLAFAIGVGTLSTGADLLDWSCAVIVLVAALIPLHIWANRHVLGVPIWPVVAFLNFLVYGVPFVSGHPLTKIYSSEEKLLAAMTIAAVICGVTLIWAIIAAGKERRIRSARIIAKGKAIRLFLTCLAVALVFQVNSVLWFVDVPSELFGILRAIIVSLCTISIFSLSYDMGAGLLTGKQKFLFVILMISYLMSIMVTLYLYAGLQTAFFAFLGFFLGGGRPPWKSVIAVALVFSVLQAGKGPLRANYWGEGGVGVTSITQSASVFTEWFAEGLYSIFVDTDPSADSLLERASVTQMVLKAETETPLFVPYLDGATYWVIPELLIPRFIWPERPTTQDTLRALSMHYGLLTQEQTETTTIGWGLIAEAFANFGYAGCAGLAVVMGLALGYLQRACGRYPIKSARGLVALIIVSCMLNVEATAASLLATIFQSVVALVLLAWLAMEERQIAG